MQLLMEQLLQSNNIMAQGLQSLATQSSPKGPSTIFPRWDGQHVSIPYFMVGVESYKRNPYFAPVKDWTHTVPGTEAQSRRIFTDLRAAIPPSHMVQFLHHPRYVDNGILMLAHLLDRLNPSRPEHRLSDIRHLVGLTQGSHESTAEYMARVRGFDARLNKVTLGEVMTIFCLLGMSDNKYDGILS